MPSLESNKLLAAAVAACENKKAEDITILALDPNESGLTDYFLICNGTNDRQNVAITDEIEIRLKRDFGVYPNSVEGRRQGEWILMDYVDFIVHVFSPEKRAFYGLERLRKTATHLSIADLNAQLNADLNTRIAASRSTSKLAMAKPVAAMPAAAAPAVAKAPTAKKKPTAKTPAKKSVAAKPVRKTATKKAAKKIAAKKPAKRTAAKKASAAKKKSAGKAPAKASTTKKKSAKKAIAPKKAAKKKAGKRT